MKDYAKPVVKVLDNNAEGVFAASGDTTVCRFGRTEANSGADTCQSCSYSGGTSSNVANVYKEDYKGCIDNMPEKN